MSHALRSAARTPPDPVPPPQDRFAALERALFRSFLRSANEPGPLGLTLWDGGASVALGCRSVPHLLVNRVALSGASGPSLAADLDTALELVRRPARPPNYLVHVDPGPEAERVEATLRTRGLVPFRRDWVVLVHDSRPALDVVTPFRIAPVQRQNADAFGRVLLEGFDGPEVLLPMLAGLVGQQGWHCYGAFDGRQLVAASAFFVHEGAAYLGFAATLPSHRGAGAHDALISRRLQVACALGCDLVLVETGLPVPGEPSPSLDNLRTAGFQPAYVRKNFAPPGTTWRG